MISGVGLGLRREIMDDIYYATKPRPAFIEIAPENWIDVGGRLGRGFRKIAERFPVVCHGLSLSLGSPEPLDWDLLAKIKEFFQQVPVVLYSEHLSYCKLGNAHLYDLFPIPFCDEAVKHVSERIRQVQDFLERQIAIENVTYYTPILPQMEEAEFLKTVLDESGAKLLLDVNNVYVNACNHKYDPYEFLGKLPLDKVAYMHMAGHFQEKEDLIIDTHGEAIIDPVYQLFGWLIARMSPVPVLLERDFGFDDIESLFEELQTLQQMVEKQWNIVV